MHWFMRDRAVKKSSHLRNKTVKRSIVGSECHNQILHYPGTKKKTSLCDEQVDSQQSGQLSLPQVARQNRT